MKESLARVARFVSWPAATGLLAALLALQWLSPSAPARSDSYADAVQQATPSVVNIYTAKVVRQNVSPLFNDPVFRHFFSRGQLPQRERIERSLGSGVIVRADGIVLTNSHVIAGADQILVMLADGRETLATVVGTDPDTDLAVLKVELTDLPAIPIGKPADARVGDVVLAIGNPYGFGQTVTQGIISATGRYGLRLNTYENFLQTDAAINPGNSGGALVNVEGALLGINTAIYSRSGGSQGIGLAIPADTAVGVLEDILKQGRVVRGWIGVEVRPLTPELAARLNTGNTQGVIVTGVARGGPADIADLRPGDIITHFDNEAIEDGHEGLQRIAAATPGQRIEARILRDGKTETLTIVAAERPRSGEQ